MTEKTFLIILGVAIALIIIYDYSVVKG